MCLTKTTLKAFKSEGILCSKDLNSELNPPYYMYTYNLGKEQEKKVLIKSIFSNYHDSFCVYKGYHSYVDILEGNYIAYIPENSLVYTGNNNDSGYKGYASSNLIILCKNNIWNRLRIKLFGVKQFINEKSSQQ